MDCFEHGLRMHGGLMFNSLQPNFMSQSQREIPLKCLKILVFCRNNGWLMKNHGLGMHNDKIFSTHLPNLANYLGYFWKISIVYEIRYDFWYVVHSWQLGLESLNTNHSPLWSKLPRQLTPLHTLARTEIIYP